MKIALLQMTSSKVPEDNLSALLSYAAKAAEKGGKVIFSPECSNIMDMNRETVLAHTQPEEQDMMVAAVKDFCRQHHVTFFLGSVVVKVADDRLANRSLVIGPAGQVIARYDKMHLFDVDLPNGESYRESRLYQGGDQAVIAALADTQVGLSVCYDVRFPYLYRHLATAGATILTVPAAFTVPTGQAHWHVLLRARAIETGSFVIAAAQCGMHETGRATYGHSLVVNPWGQVLLDAGGDIDNPEAGVHMVDIDLAEVTKARQKIPSLMHTRRIPDNFI